VCDQDSLVGLCMQDYRSAALMICATVVDPKFDFLHFDPMTLESRPNQR